MSRSISSRQSGHLCFESALLVEMASKNATPCAELHHLQNLSGLSGLEFSPQKGHPYLNYVPDSQDRDHPVYPCTERQAKEQHSWPPAAPRAPRVLSRPWAFALAFCLGQKYPFSVSPPR